jgi:hypothetical protein
MASFNLTAEDCSPLLSYYPPGAWLDASSNDTFLSAYSGSSFHSTNTSGATVTVTFNGTGITFLGGHRPNYGTYLISVDGQTVANESSAGPDIFQQVLGSAYELSNGQHTAILTSSSDLTIDIDAVYIQTEIGESGSQLSRSMIDDSNSSFVYSSGWDVNEKDYFLNNTLHYTSTAGANASISFSGDAFALYGTVSEDHANVSLSIDGKSVNVLAGAPTVSTLHTEVLLYYAQGLGSNQHTLTVSADPHSSATPFIDIDALVVYSTTGTNTGSSSQSSVSNSPSSQPDSTFSGKLTKSAVIGVVLGTIFGLLLLAGIVALLLRWRYRQGSRSRKTSAQSPSMLEAGNKGPTAQRLSQNSMSSFYIGPPPESLSRSGSVESFSSSAFINTTNAVQPVPVSQTIPTRPEQQPPPLGL